MTDQERMYKAAMIEILSDLLEVANCYLRELIHEFESNLLDDNTNFIKPEEC